MRSLLCFWKIAACFPVVWFEIRRNPSAPVCIQVSKASRRELVQRSCNIQLQTSVPKSGARKSDASAKERDVRAGVVRSKVLHAMSDLKSLLFLPMQVSKGDTVDQYQLENNAPN